MKRTPFIAGNWKMYKTGSQAVQTATELNDLTRDISGVDIMIAPTFLALPLVAQALKDSRIKTGAQNVFFEDEGAFTGEVSAPMIQSCGAQYVIIGHSERRQIFGETDSDICLKIKASLRAGLVPILCIGETEAQRDEQKTFSILDKQVSNGLKGFGSDELNKLILAYEPVWAIGTGKTASASMVDEVHQYLRALLGRLFSDDFAQKTRILYGGSVKPDNVKELMAIEDVDGALVGGASLKADVFINIINFKNN